MKVVIFAGGIGSRISEESHLRPKPMIEIGGKPILWHIMKIYLAQGYKEFVVCLGYKGYMIKEYFMNYFLHNSDISIDIDKNKVEVLETKTESFKVTLVDTGLNTKTAGRLRRVRKFLNDERFMLTYGDGVADISIEELMRAHEASGRMATLTAIQPEGRFGSLEMGQNGCTVQSFMEKPKGDGLWINGGFFVLEPGIFNYLGEDADEVMWEDAPLNNLTADGQLNAYRHKGFWKCMDAMRDRLELEEMWASNNAKWKTW
jgi:glucose-1-phosphate cytidylyltransferase